MKHGASVKLRATLGLLLFSIVAAGSLAAHAQTKKPSTPPHSKDLTSNLSIVRESHGVMRYSKAKTGEVTGSETFTVTAHPDGSRTVQARNSIYKYDIQRHVIHRVDKNFRPLETTAVYWVLGDWRGTGLFAVNDRKMSALVKSPDGILNEEIDVPEQFSFVPHPLSTNAWHAWYYDYKKGGKQEIQWYDMDAGAQTERSMLGKLSAQTLEFIGNEKLTTPAGTFDVEHFKVGTVDYYVTGPDKIMVKFYWDKLGLEYVLTEFSTKEYPQG